MRRFINTKKKMTDKTLELIASFSPKLINIPVNKCELEEVIDTLINLIDRKSVV